MREDRRPRHLRLLLSLVCRLQLPLRRRGSNLRGRELAVELLELFLERSHLLRLLIVGVLQ